MFCNKCGQEIPDGSTFCTFCGAKTTASGTMAGAPVNDYSSKIEWQPPAKPVRKGISGWGWVLIGCGGLFVLSIIAVVCGGLFMAKKMTSEFGSLENVQAAGEITIIQAGMLSYQQSKGIYGDFEALKSEGMLEGLKYSTLAQYKIESANGTYELTLPADGANFKLKCTAKKSGKVWDLDETSELLFAEAFGIDKMDELSIPTSGG